MRSWVILATVMLMSISLLTACDDNSSEPTPPPTLTGTWDINLQDGTTFIFKLNEDDGTISGTGQVSGYTGSVSGTCTSSGTIAMILSGLTFNQITARLRFNGTADGGRANLSGTIYIESESSFDPLADPQPFTAKKR